MPPCATPAPPATPAPAWPTPAPTPAPARTTGLRTSWARVCPASHVAPLSKGRNIALEPWTLWCATTSTVVEAAGAASLIAVAHSDMTSAAIKEKYWSMIKSCRYLGLAAWIRFIVARLQWGGAGAAALVADFFGAVALSQNFAVVDDARLLRSTLQCVSCPPSGVGTCTIDHAGVWRMHSAMSLVALKAPSGSPLKRKRSRVVMSLS